MSKKARGLGAAKSLISRRHTSRWLDKPFIRRTLNLKEKSDPLVASSQAKAIVLSKREITAKQPNSAKRRCARVQLIKNSKQITAFMPREGASKLIEEHDEVIVECIGGKMGRAKGDLPGVRWRVIKVNGQSLDALIKGKIEKARR